MFLWQCYCTTAGNNRLLLQYLLPIKRELGDIWALVKPKVLCMLSSHWVALTQEKMQRVSRAREFQQNYVNKKMWDSF
jgi:PP-loop superfamily ATP-utilizing enzyme